jgi:hypothetical protein
VGGSFSEAVLSIEIIELLEPASLENTDSSAVEVSIALDISSATFVTD